MILYHTSNREIVSPDIHHGRKNADFGWGFYLTPDRDFTYRWARKNAIVNVYELDETGLDTHRFTRDVSWFKYIINNRKVRDTLAADVIIGPIANDTIFDTFGIMGSGYLNPDDALKLLMIGPEYTQIAIKTEKALQQLRWLRSEKITGPVAAVRKTEQEEYDAAFGRVLQEILGESQAQAGQS